MKLEVTLNEGHSEMATAAGWNSEGHAVSVGDDKQILKWSAEGAALGKVCSLDVFVTTIAIVPSVGRNSSDQFAAACTDGTVRIFTAAGVEKAKLAHGVGAVISAKWSADGSALLSAGEDGALKVWSRNGHLRSTLVTLDKPIYAFAWGDDGESVVMTHNDSLLTKRVAGGKKQLEWKAHNGVVLAVDWNAANGLIVSGAEDCVYKVWDHFGRQLYASQPYAYVITSVSWCPSGEVFAVGAYNMLRLCDKTGWSCCRERPQCGSVVSIAWTPDGTQFVGSGGNGAVVFAQLVQRQLQWGNYEATLESPKLIVVRDVANSISTETLDSFRDRVVEMALGYGHLVVATATQCYLYNVSNWNTPLIFDLRGTVSLILLSERHFVMLDSATGVGVYSYDGGRLVSSPKFQGLRAEALTRDNVALSPETVAILDRSDSKTIRCFDIATGKMSGTITHKAEVEVVRLSQFGRGAAERRVALIDRNRELHMAPVVPIAGARATHKLLAQVDTVAWNDESDMLAAIADSRLTVWYYPNAVWVDADLLKLTADVRDGKEFGKMPQIKSFSGPRLAVRRADGSLLTAGTSYYPAMLYKAAGGGSWEEALRLCRFVKDDKMWASLACMAINKGKLDAAEEALAQVNEVDKLEFIRAIAEIPSDVARNAQLALYRRVPDEAEAILLQAQPPLRYRAIKLNITMYNWKRALQLALQSPATHVETVVAYRTKYLAHFNKNETDGGFLDARKHLGDAHPVLENGQVTINWDVIEEGERNEVANEKASSAGGRSHK